MGSRQRKAKEQERSAEQMMECCLACLLATAAELALVAWRNQKEPNLALRLKMYGTLIAAVNAALVVFGMYVGRLDSDNTIWHFGIWTYLFCLGIYDLKFRELPDWFHLLPLLFYIAAWLFGWQPVGLMESFITAFVLAAFFGLVYLLRRDALGLGDIKLILVCGWYMGSACVGVLLRGMFAAFMISILLLLCKKVTVKSGLPFVPFLFAGALLL